MVHRQLPVDSSFQHKNNIRSYLVYPYNHQSKLAKDEVQTNCLSGCGTNDCCRWELACHSRAVGSLMMHRLQKSLPNPHPSITARHLMSCFFPFIRDPCVQSSHRLPFSESKLLSKCHYNGSIVIIHLTSELGLISFFPVYPSAEHD